MSDAQRAIEVHLRRSKREDFEAILARSSIGMALDDIKKRGINAHLVDLEREMNKRRRNKKPAARKQKASPMSRIVLDVVGLEFVEGGNTIWVHGSEGTVLRIKCSGRITAKSCSAPGPHADVIVAGDIEFCVPPFGDGKTS